MLAATANSTSLHFGLNHMCRKHNVLFTMEHVEGCDEISGCSNIRSYARRLKEQNIRDWEASERRQAIAEFAALAVQMKCLQESKQAQLVQSHQFPVYQKTGRKPGRPSLREKVAESNHKMEQFFAPQHRSINSATSGNPMGGRRSRNERQNE